MTYAYFLVVTPSVTASFAPGAAVCEIVGNADGTYTVHNTGNTPVYVRVSAACAP